MFLHDAVADRQSQTGALTRSLCSEKWIVDFLDVVSADSCAAIRYLDFDLRIDRFCTDPQLAAFRHRIACIQEQIQEHLLQLSGIPDSNGAFREKLSINMNPGRLELMLQQRQGVGDDLMDIDIRKLRRVNSGK